MPEFAWLLWYCTVLIKNQQNIVQYFLFKFFFEKYRGTFDF